MYHICIRVQLFYKVLSTECGYKINNDYELVTYLRDLAYAKQEFDKISSALEQVKQTGYGIVEPRCDEIQLEQPQIVKQGGRFGVKIKAISPSIHMIKANIETEIAPIVGTEQQAEDLIRYINDSQVSENGIWDTNIFGKTVEQLVNDGIAVKTASIGEECQLKLQDTMQKVVNDGNGGMICIII